MKLKNKSKFSTSGNEFLYSNNNFRGTSGNRISLLLYWWNIIMAVSALMELFGWTVLPVIMKHLYCCYQAPLAKKRILPFLFKQGDVETYNCSTPFCDYGSTSATFTAFAHQHGSTKTLDAFTCCDRIWIYRVRFSALFTCLGFIHAFICAIQVAQKHKQYLDRARWDTVVECMNQTTSLVQRGGILLTFKRLIVKGLRYLNYRSSSLSRHSATSALSVLTVIEVLDTLQVTLVALLVLTVHLSLLPNKFWIHAADAIHNFEWKLVPDYPSHPSLEVKLRHYTIYWIHSIQTTTDNVTKQFKSHLLRIAIQHPLDFYYYLRLVHNACTLLTYLQLAVGSYFNHYSARNSLKEANIEFKQRQLTVDVLNMIVEEKDRRCIQAIVLIQRRFRNLLKSNSAYRKDQEQKPNNENQQCKASATLQRAVRRRWSTKKYQTICSCTTELHKLEDQSMRASLTNTLHHEDNSFLLLVENYNRRNLLKQKIQNLKKDNSAATFASLLLLRPNTKYALLWRHFKLACATLELLQNALYPILLRYTRTTSLEECINVWMKLNNCRQQPLRTKSIADAIFDNILFRTSTVPTAFERRQQCHDSDLTATQRFFSLFLIWFLNKFVWLTGIINFGNCFVNFFEGEYNAEGFLVPKPFFGEYLLLCTSKNSSQTVLLFSNNTWHFLLFRKMDFSRFDV